MLRSYIRIRCPICQRNMLFRSSNQFRCSKCGSVYSNGINIQDLIYTGQLLICPICRSESTYYEFRFRTYYCRKCGTRFLYNRTILEEREIQYCPRCDSRNTKFRSSSLTYKCYRCNNIF